MAATQDFYPSLYMDEPIDAALKEEFLQDLPCLSEEDRDMCEEKLSYEECYGMKDSKSSGSDGLPKDFYKEFFLVWVQFC